MSPWTIPAVWSFDISRPALNAKSSLITSLSITPPTSSMRIDLSSKLTSYKTGVLTPARLASLKSLASLLHRIFLILSSISAIL